jgi:molybdate/tungstate transport system permease protein
MGFFILVFIILPILSLLLAEKPEVILENLQKPLVINAIFFSIYTAFLTTLLAFIFGIPLAYVLARKNFFGKSIVSAIVDIPIVMPHTVAGIALLTVFSPEGIIGGTIGLQFVNTALGTIIAMLFVSAPFLINSAREGFETVDPRLENVARSLGCTKLGAFTKVSFPLASKHILTGAIMTWARAISEFGAVAIIAYYPMTATTLIWDRLSYGPTYYRPVAILLIILCLAVFAFLRYISKPKHD